MQLYSVSTVNTYSYTCQHSHADGAKSSVTALPSTKPELRSPMGNAGATPLSTQLEIARSDTETS